MATTTKLGSRPNNLKRTVTKAARAHDNLYDPVYNSSSGEKAHFRQYNQNMMKRLERVANYDNMFSDHMPRYSYRISSNKKGPAVGMLPPVGASKAPAPNQHSLMGSDRLKYLKRPSVPFLSEMPGTQIVLAKTKPKAAAAEAKYRSNSAKNIVLGTPRARTVGVQTLYRESETQTDPYTPDYIVPEGAPEPEILSIAHFTHANGMLPVAKYEVDIIKRMREKKAYLATLPKFTDEASLQKRKKMLAYQERKEWKLREAEVFEEQDAKLQHLLTKLRARDDKAQEYLDRRLEMLTQSKLAKRSEMLSQVHEERVLGFRRLGKDAANAQAKRHKRDVIGDYDSHESAVYAPVARDGKLPVKNQVVDYGIPLIQDYQGLASLESRIPQHLEAKAVRPESKRVLKRREKMRQDHLAHVDALIHGDDVGPSGEGITNIYKKLQPTFRPKTPEIEDVDESGLEEAAVMLQKLIRGRAVQNVMHEDKTRSLPLIQELRIEAAEEPEPTTEQKLEAELGAGIDLVSGSIVSHTLAFMAGHMLQQREQKRVFDLVSEAKKKRKKREAEEAARRQSEANAFARLDEATKIVMGVNQNTVDSFVENLIRNVIHDISTQNATQAAEDRPEGEDESKQSNREIVSRLVKDFLVPEVDRQREKNLKDLAHSRFSRAVHDAMTRATSSCAAHMSGTGGEGTS